MRLLPSACVVQAQHQQSDLLLLLLHLPVTRPGSRQLSKKRERKPRRGKHRYLKIFISPMAALSWCTEFKNWIYPKVRNSKTLGSCWLRTIVAHEVNLTSDQVPSISSRRPIAALNRPPSWRSILIVFSCLIMSDLISSYTTVYVVCDQLRLFSLSWKSAEMADPCNTCHGQVALTKGTWRPSDSELKCAGPVVSLHFTARFHLRSVSNPLSLVFCVV